MSQDPFRPTSVSSSIDCAALTTAAAFALPQGDGCQLRVVNETTGTIRVGFGTSSTVPAGFSTTNGMAMITLTTATFTLDQYLLGTQGYIYLSAGTAGNVNVTRGSGN